MKHTAHGKRYIPLFLFFFQRTPAMGEYSPTSGRHLADKWRVSPAIAICMRIFCNDPLSNIVPTANLWRENEWLVIRSKFEVGRVVSQPASRIWLVRLLIITWVLKRTAAYFFPQRCERRPDHQTEEERGTRGLRHREEMVRIPCLQNLDVGIFLWVSVEPQVHDTSDQRSRRGEHHNPT